MYNNLEEQLREGHRNAQVLQVVERRRVLALLARAAKKAGDQLLDEAGIPVPVRGPIYLGAAVLLRDFLGDLVGQEPQD